MDEEQITDESSSEPLAPVPVESDLPPVAEDPVSIDPEPTPTPIPSTLPPNSEPAPTPAVPRSESSNSTTGVTEPEKPIEPPPVTEPQSAPSSESLTSVPKIEQSESQSSTAGPFDINSLSDEQLKAAAALYTKRNQQEISRKGVARRKEIMELNLRQITDYLSRNNGAPLPRIAKNTSITLGTTSKYLRQLIASGKVRAEGWGKTRRFYLK